MQVKRFVAADMRRALELVRLELGADAIILSSRRVKEGVELLTTLASDTAPASMQATAAPAANSGGIEAPSLFGEAVSHKQGKTGRDIAEEIEMAARRRKAERVAGESASEFLQANQVVNAGIRVASPAASARPQSAAERYGLMEPSAQPAEGKKRMHSDTDISDLQEELAEMRLLLEEQLNRLGAMPPGGNKKAMGAVARRLQRMGFDEGIVRAMPETGNALAQAWPAAMTKLAQRLPVASTDIIAKGGIHALVGPTGAGKTTTIAKLAARYVMARGVDKVALVTTDAASMAGRAALKSIGAILQVPVRVVDADNPLDHVLRSLRRCELVLIDTAGMRPGDPGLKGQLQALARMPRIQTHLVIPANSQAQMLKASVHAYSPAGLKTCILTKLDETRSLGEALSIVMRSRLPIAYTTDGQDVPADIAVPRAQQLLHRAQQLAERQIKTRRAN